MLDFLFVSLICYPYFEVYLTGRLLLVIFEFVECLTCRHLHVGVEDGDDDDAEDQPGMTEDIHPTGWKVKGKRNSFGSHSPVSNGVSG